MKTIKVKAVPERLLLDIQRSTARNRHYVGLRECNRGPDGSHIEEASRVLPGAPGISVDGKGNYVGQSSDLFVSGFPVHLTNLDANGDELVVEVPIEGAIGLYFRTALADGDIVAA